MEWKNQVLGVARFIGRLSGDIHSYVHMYVHHYYHQAFPPFSLKSPTTRMSVCAVCSSPAPHKCARCKCVFYCSPAHQKEDWGAHKIQCHRLAQEALAAVFHPCDEELLLRITTCLAQNG